MALNNSSPGSKHMCEYGTCLVETSIHMLEPKNTCTGAGFPCSLHYVGISMILLIPPRSAERTCQYQGRSEGLEYLGYLRATTNTPPTIHGKAVKRKTKMGDGRRDPKGH
jgi:hypothetical protein